MDPLNLEVSEFWEIGELQIASLGNSNTDGSVIIDDSGVELDWKGSKKPLDVLAVQGEFTDSMPEDKQRRFDRCFPGNDPVAMRSNSLGWC